MSESRSYNMLSEPDEYQTFQDGYKQGRADAIEEVREIVMNHPFSFDAKIAMDVLLEKMKEQKHE